MRGTMLNIRTVGRVGVCVLAALALPFASPAHASIVAVTVGSTSYSPTPVTAKPGDTVKWTWAVGSGSHSVTSDAGSEEPFASSTQTSGTFAHRFDFAGTFTYHCVVQGVSMSGTVSVAGISGRVLADSDAGNSVTGADVRLEGVTVQVFDSLAYQENPQGAPPLDATETDSDGRYSFDNPVSPSPFITVHVPQQPGFEVATDVSRHLPDRATTVNEHADFLLEGAGTVSGTVWNDVNGNGTHDLPESGQSAVSVSLDGKRSTTTDANGNYSFAHALPGLSAVSVTAPSGFGVIGSASRPIDLQDPDYTATGQDFFVQQLPGSTSGTTGTTSGGTTGTTSGGTTGGTSTSGTTVETGGGAALDRTAPSLSAVSLTRRRFAVGTAATARSASTARGTTFRYTLSEDATLTIRIDQLLPGRRSGTRCLGHRRTGRGCTRAVLRGTLTRAVKTGPVRTDFSGRIGSRALARGNYRATLVARDAAGNGSAPAALAFSVVR